MLKAYPKYLTNGKEQGNAGHIIEIQEKPARAEGRELQTPLKKEKGVER